MYWDRKYAFHQIVLQQQWPYSGVLTYVPWSKVAILGMVITPFNRNPYNGYINPYGLGLMSLSPIIWKCHGSWSTRSHIYTILTINLVVPMGSDLYTEQMQTSGSSEKKQVESATWLCFLRSWHHDMCHVAYLTRSQFSNIHSPWSYKLCMFSKTLLDLIGIYHFFCFELPRIRLWGLIFEDTKWEFGQKGYYKCDAVPNQNHPRHLVGVITKNPARCFRNGISKNWGWELDFVERYVFGVRWCGDAR